MCVSESVCVRACVSACVCVCSAVWPIFFRGHGFLKSFSISFASFI